MLVKNRYLSFLNSSGIERKNVFSREKKTERKEYCNYKFNTHSNERKIYDFKNVWTSEGKSYLRIDQEIQVYFMINPDPVGNEQGLHYEKRKTIYFFMFIFGFM